MKRFTVLFPLDLYKRICDAAEAEGLSVSAWIKTTLVAALKASKR